MTADAAGARLKADRDLNRRVSDANDPGLIAP